MTKRVWVIGLVATVVSLSLGAQQRTVVAFYNTENLMDTLPSLFYDDSQWTPPRWNGERYNIKIRNLARVLDDIGADIVGLAEVENEAVVRDLVTVSNEGYNYIHRTSSDWRGIDLALLYHGDRFYPLSTELLNSTTGREFLHVTGILDSDTVALLVCHLPSQLNSGSYRKKAMLRLCTVVDSLLKVESNLIVMGDFNASPSDRTYRQTIAKLSIHQAITTRAGSYAYRSRWQLFDQILISPSLLAQCRLGSVFIRDYLLVSYGNRRGYPRRTFSSRLYEGGASDHLPVYIILGISTTVTNR